MGIWTDIAQWVGPTPNRGGAMIEWRGVVIHIAEGSYEGTISWQKNDSSNVSSHFIVAKDGRIAQMVDTDQVAWTQAGGNGRWLSIENEGFSGQSLTPAQLEANAKIIAKAHKIYGFPLVLAESPSAKGIGWHGMGGTAWGNHPNCPGVPIRNQRPEMISRATQLLGQTPGSFSRGVNMHLVRSGAGDGSIYLCLGYPARSGKLACQAVYGAEWEAYKAALPTVQLPSGVSVAATGRYDTSGDITPWSGSVDLSAVRTIVREELAKDPGVSPEQVTAITAATAAAAASALDNVTITATIQRPE